MRAGTDGHPYVYCPQCGGENPDYARFCGICGTALSASSSSSSSPSSQGDAMPSLPLPAPFTRELTPSELAEVDDAVSTVDTQRQGPLKPFMPELLKQRYRILERIGSGGYGHVFRAIDTAFMQRQVAIKEMIQEGLSPDAVKEATEGFKREARLLASLTHPNLPSIYDFFEISGCWYVVMSFIEGTTLDVYVQKRGGRLAPEKVLIIGIQLAGALSYLHTRKPPVVFRDLKPSNVMRTPEGQLYLIDFGIARYFKQGQSKDTLILGSPGYAAPEQYGRQQTSPQADIYSLGVLLHELLSGQNPLQTPFSQPRLDIPEYPQLSALVQCMLELDVKKRPASMLNIQHELQRIANRRGYPFTNVHPAISAQHPVVAPPPGSVLADPVVDTSVHIPALITRVVRALTEGSLPALRKVRKQEH